MGRRILEKKSLRREASGRHLGGIRGASGRHLGLQEAMGLQEAPNHKKSMPLSARMQKFP